MAGNQPQSPVQLGKMGYFASDTQRVADPDRGDSGQGTGEDHYAHAVGKICKTCGQTIEAGQTAHRRGGTEWAHDVCPVITD